MHEQGIAQEMVSIVLRHAEANQAQRVIQLDIEMTETVDESEDSLRLYLEQLTRGTIAENAQFEIRHVGAPAECKNCGQAFERHGMFEPCPRCHSTRVASTQNEDFRLTSIQIE